MSRTPSETWSNIEVSWRAARGPLRTRRRGEREIARAAVPPPGENCYFPAMPILADDGASAAIASERSPPARAGASANSSATPVRATGRSRNATTASPSPRRSPVRSPIAAKRARRRCFPARCCSATPASATPAATPTAAAIAVFRSSLAPEAFAEIAASAAGASRYRFAADAAPPHAALTPLVAGLESLARRASPLRIEERALEAAARIVAIVAGRAFARRARRRANSSASPRPRARSKHRSNDETLDLAALARIARLSKFHFLRVFRRAVGATPHQYLIATRSAARRGALERNVRERDVDRLRLRFRRPVDLQRAFPRRVRPDAVGVSAQRRLT